MRTALNTVAYGLQKCWEIVLPMFFMMPGQTTIKMAAVLAMIAHQASYMHHTRSICSEQRKENFRPKFALESAIPDLQALLLQRDQVLQPWEQK